jgi:glycosyltransferase involved in cell wall biosynthesis
MEILRPGIDNKSRPCLEIAVPTFDRRAHLEGLVGKLEPWLCDDVHLLLIDNASTDGTESYCKDLVTRSGGTVRYIRNAANIGGGPNMLRCIEYAIGEFVWLVGDDEEIVGEQIPALVVRLAESSANAMHICPNNESIARFRHCGECVFHESRKFIESFYSFPSFLAMPSHVVRVDAAKQYLRGAYAFVQWQHPYAYVTYALMLNGGLEVVDLPLVRYRSVESRVSTEPPRWTAMPANVNASETMYHLAEPEFRYLVIDREFRERKGTYLFLLLQGLLNKDNVGLESADLVRLGRMLNWRHRWYPMIGVVFIAMTSYRVLRRVLAIAIVCVTVVRKRSVGRKRLLESLRLEESSDKQSVVEQVYSAISGYSQNRGRNCPIRN